MTDLSSSGWARPRPDRAGFRADTALAVGLALAATLTSLLYARTGIYGEPAQPWVWALGIASCTIPLAWRRRYPLPVAIIVAAGFFVSGQFQVPEVLVINICLFIALYTLGAWEPNRSVALWGQLVIALAMFTWLIISLVVASSAEDAMPEVSRSGIFSAYATMAAIQTITNLLYFGGAYFFGERTWRAARLQAQLETQGHELELERRTSAAQAVALDRIAIARELHDVVAHHVSVMGIQAAAARRGMAANPDRAVQSLEIVEQSAERAVEELRQLVQTLRTPDTEGESAATTLGIAQLPTLVSSSREAGVPTTLIVVGTPRPLPMLIDVSLYRVAQEALTNVRKHAGRGAEAVVRLRFEPEAVELEVSDTGVHQRMGATQRDAVSKSDLGLGLRGMRERIGAVGGEILTSRRETSSESAITGGFLVRARVPQVASRTEAST